MIKAEFPLTFTPAVLLLHDRGEWSTKLRVLAGSWGFLVCGEGIAMLILSAIPHLVSLLHLQPHCYLLLCYSRRRKGKSLLKIMCALLERKGCGFASQTHEGTQTWVFASLKVDCGYSLHFLPHLPSNLGKQKSFTQSWQMNSGMGLWVLNPLFTESLISWMWVNAKPWLYGGFQIHPSF